MAKYLPGQSGNPNGRPKGTGAVAKLREAIQEEMTEIISVVVSAAKAGDIGAAKILMDKVIPTLKPINPPGIDGLDGDNVIHIRWAGGE